MSIKVNRYVYVYIIHTHFRGGDGGSKYQSAMATYNSLKFHNCLKVYDNSYIRHCLPSEVYFPNFCQLALLLC